MVKKKKQTQKLNNAREKERPTGRKTDTKIASIVIGLLLQCNNQFHVDIESFNLYVFGELCESANTFMEVK